MEARDVRSAARAGRITQSERYHAGRHGVAWGTIRLALASTHRVVPDPRATRAGRRRHPQGFMAWCKIAGHPVIRVDFDVERHKGRIWVVVVTAFEVRP